METQTIISITLGILGIGGVIFSVFNFFRKPQEQSDITQAVAGKELETKATVLAQKEMENKAALLEQQVKLAYEANEKKFQEMGIRIDKVVFQMDNLIVTSTAWHLDISNKLVELSTIISERIDRRK